MSKKLKPIVAQPERNLDLEDALGEIADGFRIWRDSKELDWSDKDEAFERWLKASDYWGYFE